MSAATLDPGRDSRVASRLIHLRELGIVAALGLLILYTTLQNPRFLSAQSVRDLLLGASILVVMAVGQTMVIVTRNVDLSVGSVLGLTAFAVGKFFLASPDVPIVLGIAVGVLLGAALGAFNGALVSALQVPALVVTLGTLYVFRGIDFMWASGQQINAADMPDAFLDLGSARVVGVPILALIAVVVVVLASWYMGAYRSGRELYAIGSAPEAARLSGIPVGRRVFTAFVVSGALAGLGGAMHAARFGTLDATVGTALELQVVAAAVVGGVAIFGGIGTAYGAAAGAVLLTTIGSALPVLRINQFWQQAVVGLLIVAAIALDKGLRDTLTTRLRQGGGHGG